MLCFKKPLRGYTLITHRNKLLSKKALAQNFNAAHAIVIHCIFVEVCRIVRLQAGKLCFYEWIFIGIFWRIHFKFYSRFDWEDSSSSHSPRIVIVSIFDTGTRKSNWSAVKSVKGNKYMHKRKKVSYRLATAVSLYCFICCLNFLAVSGCHWHCLVIHDALWLAFRDNFHNVFVSYFIVICQEQRKRQQWEYWLSFPSTEEKCCLSKYLNRWGL